MNQVKLVIDGESWSSMGSHVEVSFLMPRMTFARSNREGVGINPYIVSQFIVGCFFQKWTPGYLLRTDPNFDTGLIHIPWSKTEEAECYLPMSSALQAELKAYLASRTDDSDYLFPVDRRRPKGRKSIPGGVSLKR